MMLYCSGVSSCFHSASVLITFSMPFCFELSPCVLGSNDSAPETLDSAANAPRTKEDDRKFRRFIYGLYDIADCLTSQITRLAGESDSERPSLPSMPRL